MSNHFSKFISPSPCYLNNLGNCKVIYLNAADFGRSDTIIYLIKKPA